MIALPQTLRCISDGCFAAKTMIVGETQQEGNKGQRTHTHTRTSD